MVLIVLRDINKDWNCVNLKTKVPIYKVISPIVMHPVTLVSPRNISKLILSQRYLLLYFKVVSIYHILK